MYRVVWRQLIIFAHNLVIFVIVLIVFPQDPGWGVAGVPGVRTVHPQFGVGGDRIRHSVDQVPDIGQLLTTSVQLVFFADADHLVRRRFEQHDARVVRQAQDRRDQPDVPLS